MNAPRTIRTAMNSILCEAVRLDVKRRTRRIVANPIAADASEVIAWFGPEHSDPVDGLGEQSEFGLWWRCPRGLIYGGPCRYGKPGDRLALCEGLKKTPDGLVGYADGTAALRDGRTVAWPWKPAGLPGRYAPAWTVRTVVPIEAIDLRPLRDITEQEARLEGAVFWWARKTGQEDHGESMLHAPAGCRRGHYGRACFKELFTSIHAGKKAWEANPIVWDIAFGDPIDGGE